MEEIDHNSSVIDTSAFHDGDLDLFLDCIQQLCDKKLKKKSKKRGQRSVQSQIDNESLHNHYEQVDFDYGHSVNMADPHHDAANAAIYMNETDNSFNVSDYSQIASNNDVADTDLTYLSEQFNDIFRYFDEDVDKTLFDEVDVDVVSSASCSMDAMKPKTTPKKRSVEQAPAENTEVALQQPEQQPLSSQQSQLMPPPPASQRSQRFSRSYGPKKNGWSREYRELQNKSNGILKTIKVNEEFHNKLRKFQQKIEESSEESDCRGGNYPRAGDKLNQTCADIYRQNRTSNDLMGDNIRASLSSSCLSICETDSDAPGIMQSKPYNNGAYSRPNVRTKIQFFNNSTSTSRCSSASPFGSSEDDECELYRRNSKRIFQQKRQYFEKIQNREQPTASVGTDAMAPADGDGPFTNDSEGSEETFDRRIEALQQFVQTRHLLERIQILNKAFTKLDEKRLSTMNLDRLKKFMVFLRDAWYKCQEVCFNISEEFLDGFKQNVTSAEELLFSIYSAQSEPPENELQKCHDNNTASSEHQLRIQQSLQKLNIPVWFKQYTEANKSDGGASGGYVPGSFAKKRNSDATGGWRGLNSKTTSLSSLGSQRSDRSPLLLSPSAHSHHGQTGFSRWSTSHLNSSQTSPSASTRGSFSRGGNNSSIMSGTSFGNQSSNSIRNSFRQPYMGWRSQEKLSQPRTPHERLASSLLSRQSKQPASDDQQRESKPANEHVVTPEIQSSIKEVTSAIVHFVNDQNSRTGSSNSQSPTSRNCWQESSSTQGNTRATPPSRLNGVDALPEFSVQTDRPSPNSATLEDVLASLLGLPSDSYRSSAVTNISAIISEPSSSHLQIEVQPSRRRSEGDAQKNQESTPTHSPIVRRTSLDSSESKSATGNASSTNNSAAGPAPEMQRCRYPKCETMAPIQEARRSFKSCHNCPNMYCSRECRRAHWEKHRKACLHSRVSVLCRQVLSTCKDDHDTLRHLTILARQGFAVHGRGVVRVLFRSSESAEVFVNQGFQRLGEASFVRWPELLPQEMGTDLYVELLRLSNEYKPESKMLVYVAICVVSEAPRCAAAAVKWERQLVSRCAKLKLCKSVPCEISPIPLHAQICAGIYVNSSSHGSSSISSGAGCSSGHRSNAPSSSSPPASASSTTVTAHASKSTPSGQTAPKSHSDILILTFNMASKQMQTLRNREIVVHTVQNHLRKRGVSLRRHYPEVFQRLTTFVEGSTDRLLPVTINPKDTTTGRAFTCIVMPHVGDVNRIKMPNTEGEQTIETIDCLEGVPPD